MSTRKDSKTNSFKDLKDLAKYRDSFLAEPLAQDVFNAKLKTQIIPNKSIKIGIKEIKNPTLEAAKNNKKTFRVKIHSNFRSVNDNDEKFNNYLDKINYKYECSAIRSLFRIFDTVCDINEIPFQLQEEELTVRDRHKKIFKLYQINDIKEVIHKATYIDPLRRDILDDKKINNKIRIFFKKDESNIEIVMIDLYHLFATTDYREFDNVYKYRTCINTLKKK